MSINTKRSRKTAIAEADSSTTRLYQLRRSTSAASQIVVPTKASVRSVGRPRKVNVHSSESISDESNGTNRSQSSGRSSTRTMTRSKSSASNISTRAKTTESTALRTHASANDTDSSMSGEQTFEKYMDDSVSSANKVRARAGIKQKRAFEASASSTKHDGDGAMIKSKRNRITNSNNYNDNSHNHNSNNNNNSDNENSGDVVDERDDSQSDGNDGSLDTLSNTKEIKKRTRTKRRYICEYCNKEFLGGNDLRKHIRIHTDERPFECKHCSQKFRQGGCLKNHIASQHGTTETYTCYYCNKTFPIKERLRLHMRLHSGEKPYQCKICFKRFARGGQVRFVQHQRDFSEFFHFFFKSSENLVVFFFNGFFSSSPL